MYCVGRAVGQRRPPHPEQTPLLLQPHPLCTHDLAPIGRKCQQTWQFANFSPRTTQRGGSGVSVRQTDSGLFQRPGDTLFTKVF